MTNKLISDYDTATSYTWTEKLLIDTWTDYKNIELSTIVGEWQDWTPIVANDVMTFTPSYIYAKYRVFNGICYFSISLNFSDIANTWTDDAYAIKFNLPVAKVTGAESIGGWWLYLNVDWDRSGVCRIPTDKNFIGIYRAINAKLTVEEYGKASATWFYEIN